ncbi:MAG: hypothetical protein QOK23_2645 [Gammaproteobacteria bacterium]|jgi:hypothetical protein|nr:hypothetical protein [Gammaproteobacteria bacterium]
MPNLIVLEYFAQFLFQLPLGQHVFYPAPCSLAAFARGHRFRAAFGALDEGIEIVRFFGFAEKLIVDIEMFVFAFAHFWRKAPEINGIDQLSL